jgi:hypothetical protein
MKWVFLAFDVLNGYVLGRRFVRIAECGAASLFGTAHLI